MLGLVQNVTGMEVNPFDWISIFDIFFVLDLIIFPFLAYFYEKNKSEEKPIFEKYKKLTALILSGAIILGFLPICSLINVFPKAFDTIYRPAYEKNISLYFTAPGFHIIDIADAIFGSDEKNELKEEDKEQINAFYAWNDENLPDNEYAGIIKDKNVILIQMESIEAFVLGQSINGQEITPNLNRILEKSISFTNIYEQTKSGNSSDCDFMMMTSLLPIKKSRQARVISARDKDIGS
jgi:phosphoglycerol transferase MdoB-like AlkP superfamily enzyme